MIKNCFLKCIIFSALILLANLSQAATYELPPQNEALVGRLHYTATQTSDTVLSVARRYDIGFNALQNANPYINPMRSFSYATPLQIPNLTLLPPHERKGIIVNLTEMRLYYYPAGTGNVKIYPIGIGQVGKMIPMQKAYVTRKSINPTWIPPDDIRQYVIEKMGITLPKIMPAGPDNPLGPFAIYLSIPTYLIHSTIFPESVGRRASFGCIRMYESDIKEFYPSIERKIPVTIINDSVKVGWKGRRLYMEAHDPLEESTHIPDASLPGVVHLISQTTQNEPVLIDWQLVSYLSERRDGIPHEIGTLYSK